MMLPGSLHLFPGSSPSNTHVTQKMYMKALKFPVMLCVSCYPCGSARRTAVAASTDINQIIWTLQKTSSQTLSLLSSVQREERFISVKHHFPIHPQRRFKRAHLWVQTGPSSCLTHHNIIFLLIYSKWHQIQRCKSYLSLQHDPPCPNFWPNLLPAFQFPVCSPSIFIDFSPTPL